MIPLWAVFSPGVTFSEIIAQDHKQDADIDAVKIQNISSPRLPHAALL